MHDLIAPASWHRCGREAKQRDRTLSMFASPFLRTPWEQCDLRHVWTTHVGGAAVG
jgi:hypothetical protein